jgi:hypothetical protein
MRTLLLCGYRTRDENEVALGVGRDDNGETLIDRRIVQLRALGLDVVCVLAGANADEQLRYCRTIQDTELVFDTNEPMSLLSNTRAGSFAVPGDACFAIPVEVVPPPAETWGFLLNEYGKLGFGTKHGILQAVDPIQGAPWHFGFPLLITREGTKILTKTPDLRSLVDTRLKYLQLPLGNDLGLAQGATPL